MFTNFVVSKDKENINRLFNPKLQKMNATKFKKEVALVVQLLYQQRLMSDKSDKRIVRDTIRAIVKELTRVN